MNRRRRHAREIPFSFDSFLDIVANVVGVIIRLILVVWVGARSYTTLQHLAKTRNALRNKDVVYPVLQIPMFATDM